MYLEVGNTLVLPSEKQEKTESSLTCQKDLLRAVLMVTECIEEQK